MPETPGLSLEHQRVVRGQVYRWLRETTEGNIRPLRPRELSRYTIRSFTVGWSIGIEAAGRAWELHILLSPTFPFDAPRIAIAEEGLYGKWPHVEAQGVLCLPPFDIDRTNPIESVRASVEFACGLIANCHPTVPTDELRREFVAYWNRTYTDPVGTFSSLVTPGGNSRLISAWNSRNQTYLAENARDLGRWLRATGIEEPRQGYTFTKGIYCRLNQPPAPPFVASIREAIDWLIAESPDALELLKPFAAEQGAVPLVLAAEAENKIGLIGLTLVGKQNPHINGFRRGKAPGAIMFNHWAQPNKAFRRKVRRLDAVWVHGRGANPYQSALYAKSVTILGCGSLGSHVAVRLAQAGVGGLYMVDHETLEPANVGRHALGIPEVGSLKASALADTIRRRFPHLRSIESATERWEDLKPDQLERLKQSDLILSLIGDRGSEATLNHWHMELGGQPPILYGWLEEHATAAHAVLVKSPRSCLECLLLPNGYVRDRETHWDAGQIVDSEPACGTSFAPFGPIEIANAEALICEQAVDVLLGKIEENTHRVHATSTGKLSDLAGSWTDYHRQFRPAGFDDHLTSARPFPNSPDCIFATIHASFAH